MSVGRSVRPSVRPSVANYEEHAIYGDRPCFLLAHKTTAYFLLCDFPLASGLFDAFPPFLDIYVDLDVEPEDGTKGDDEFKESHK